MMKAMKKALSLLLTLALTLALGACGKGGEGEEENNDIQLSDELSGETLTAGDAADKVFSLAVDLEKSLNPITTTSTLNQNVDNLVYDRLFEVDENFNVTSRILEDWYYSKNDNGGGTWILSVRDGIKMHDGSTLTADDIVYSVSRIATSGSTYFQQTGRVYCSAFQGQVYLTGDYANGLLPQRMSIPVIKQVENSILQNTPVGSGPYVFSEDLSCLEKFEDYETADTLPFDKVYLRPYTDPEGLITEYESALVDLVLNDPTSIYNMGYGGKNETRSYATTNLHFVCFNSRSEFFQYDAYRTAMSWIVDREGIAEDVLDGHADAAAIPIHPNSSLFDKEAADEIAFDPDRCRLELERGGCRDLDGDGMLEYALSGTKKEIEINFLVCADSADKVAAARRIASDMEAVGLYVHMREMTWKEYQAALRADPDAEDEEDRPEWIWDMFYGEIFMASDWNTLTLYTGDWEKDGTLNYGKWNVPELQQAMYAFIGATPEERPAAEEDYLAALRQTTTFLSVCYEKKQVLTHIGIVKGINPNQFNALAGVANWQVNLG